MAKVVGLVGSASGKLGNVVYAVTNGIQVARVYQPIVNNPKSPLQLIQRAKGNLVGRISAVTPWEILAGLGSSRRSRRARFNKLALEAATVVLSDGIYSAKLDVNNFVFSEGALTPMGGLRAPDATETQVGTALSRLAHVTDEEIEGNGMLVVCLILASDGTYEEVKYKFVPVPITGTTSVTFPHIAEGSYEAHILAAPYKVIDSALSTKTTELIGNDSQLAATLSVASETAVTWGRSRLYGSVSFTQS